MAEQQLSMAERQERHRQVVEAQMVGGMDRRANHGLYLGWVLAVFVMAGAMWLVALGHDAAGVSIGTIDLGSLVGVFVYGRYDQRRQENQRQQSG